MFHVGKCNSYPLWCDFSEFGSAKTRLSLAEHRVKQILVCKPRLFYTSDAADAGLGCDLPTILTIQKTTSRLMIIDCHHILPHPTKKSCQSGSRIGGRKPDQPLFHLAMAFQWVGSRPDAPIRQLPHLEAQRERKPWKWTNTLSLGGSCSCP